MSIQMLYIRMLKHSNVKCLTFECIHNHNYFVCKIVFVVFVFVFVKLCVFVILKLCL